MTEKNEMKLSSVSRCSGEPLLTVHGCALLERDTGKGYTYRAVNLKSGQSAFLSRRKSPLTISGMDAMVEMVRCCSVAAVGSMVADMPPGDSLSYTALMEILSHIFQDILPAHGFAFREAQADLSAHIMQTIRLRNISLAEAGVGSGKTLAYLVAAALAKRGRVNDFWLSGSYPDQSFADSAHLPVVLSTSSIALQNAIAKDYIPELSRILMAHGIILSPLTAVIRKGREHYLCDHRLRTYYADSDSGTKAIIAPLLGSAASIDLADVEGLTPYMKRRIGVSVRCGEDCPCRESCRYLSHLKEVKSNHHDFQITNHNYLLADILRRKAGQLPLIPHYQAVIIDEGHKFLAAARQMYSVELSCETISALTTIIRNILFRRDDGPKIWRKTRKLYGQHKELFSLLSLSTSDEETERATISLEGETERHIRNICLIAGQLLELLEEAEAIPRHVGRVDQVVWGLKSVQERASALERHSDLICWLEVGTEIKLCGTSKHLDELLCADFWSKGTPVIITSGTLSAAGSFGRIKHTLGLDRLPPRRILEIRKSSPFRYHDNALIYISKTMAFPDSQNTGYLVDIAVETGRLIRASHGHAAVLFTSYRAMDMVWEQLSAQHLPFPLFRLDRVGVSAISGFKSSGNGVLFASGALWEGIDIPGDSLSMLIIVKLPFPVPDPIGDYERTLYGSMADYKNNVILPDMLVKLRQGFGRLLRTESDNGIVALLDCRVQLGGAYRDQVLRALPPCLVTDDITNVSLFLMQKKTPEYFT